jgi:hypothetical protein
MRTAAKGNAAEAAVLHALIERDLNVLVPFGDGQPYDLVVQIPPEGFLRVQCKTARRKKGCLVFNARTTDHGKGRLPYVGLADLFGVYFPPTQSVYLVPVRDAQTYYGWLRLDPTRNNQRRRVKFAAEYEIERWTIDALAGLLKAGRAPLRLAA